MRIEITSWSISLECQFLIGHPDEKKDCQLRLYYRLVFEEQPLLDR